MVSQVGEMLIPYNVEKIQRDCKWFSADTIRVALKLYQAVGLVYEEVDGTLTLADHKNLVGSETDAAGRMRDSRANRAQELPAPATPDATEGEHCANIVTPDIRYKSLDTRVKSLDIKSSEKEDNGIMPGAETTPAPKPTTSPVVITITLNDKSEYPITEADVCTWQGLYPAVDIMQALRNMKGWADANPGKRKTRSGIKRFVNSWLSREQDRYHGPSEGASYGTNQPGYGAGSGTPERYGGYL